MKKLAQSSFLVALFMGVCFMASGQSTTVQVTNNTACTKKITVPGSFIAGSCIAHAEAKGAVPAGSTVTLTFIDQSTGNPTAAYTIGGSAHHTPATWPSPWVSANTSVNPSCGTATTGTSPASCGGTFNVVITPALNVVIQ